MHHSLDYQKRKEAGDQKWVKVHEPHAVMLTIERDFVQGTTWYVQHILSYVI